MSETALYTWIDRAKAYTPAPKDKAEPQNLTEQVKVASEMVQRRQAQRIVEDIEDEAETEGVEWVLNNVTNGNWKDAAKAMWDMSATDQQEVYSGLSPHDRSVLARIMDNLKGHMETTSSNMMRRGRLGSAKQGWR